MLPTDHPRSGTRKNSVAYEMASAAISLHRRGTISISLLVFLAIVFVSAPAHAEDDVSFREDLAPILIKNCVGCHGDKTAESGFRLDSFTRAFEKGESGSVGFTAGMLEKSEVFHRLVSDDADERMPPESDPLPAEQIAMFKRWIEAGAKFDGDNPDAPLISIVPAPTHPPAPESYPFTIPVSALVFSHDGKSLIAGGYHELTVWNAETGELLRRISNVGRRTYALAISPDGKTLAAAGGSPGSLGEVRLFNPETGELLRAFGAESDVVLDAAFNAKGDQLVVAVTDGSLKTFDAATGRGLLTIAGHADWVTTVAWNSDGTKIASGSRDKTVKIFEATTGELVATYSGHGQPVRGVAFHPAGTEIFSSGDDKRIHRWKIADAVKTSDIGFGGEVFRLQIVGEFLFTSSADKTVRQFEVESHKQLHSLTGHKDSPVSVTWHPATKRLASGGFDGEVIVWDLNEKKPKLTFIAAPGYSAALSYSSRARK
jgi:DNA-binding beta-propeller fold protein YncE